MLDHAFEGPDEERERETTDAHWEYARYEHHRGDDRLEPNPFLPHDVRASASTSSQRRGRRSKAQAPAAACEPTTDHKEAA